MTNETTATNLIEEALKLATDRAEKAETELADLKAKQAANKKAEKKPKVVRADKSADTRKIGAMKPPKNDDEAAAREAALAEAFAADTTQVVFTDGQREIRELAPLTVNGDAWRDTPQGRVLDHEPLLEPGDMSRESVELRGFGLLNADGKQVAYQALPEPVVVRRNQLVQLSKNTIRF